MCCPSSDESRGGGGVVDGSEDLAAFSPLFHVGWDVGCLGSDCLGPFQSFVALAQPPLAFAHQALPSWLEVSPSLLQAGPLP